MMKGLKNQSLSIALILFCINATACADDTRETINAWNQLRQGTAVAIMRHALAPGTGDPAYFTLGDCKTQRNLSEQGREQARRAGDLFRSKGITNARILSSQWCRCQETAVLLGMNTPEPFPALNSFFENRSTANEQTNSLREAMPVWLHEENNVPTILVTHQVNISALTGSFTRSGEIHIIAIRDEQIVVLASVPTAE